MNAKMKEYTPLPMFDEKVVAIQKLPVRVTVVGKKLWLVLALFTTILILHCTSVLTFILSSLSVKFTTATPIIFDVPHASIHCPNVSPIAESSYISRQNALAEVLYNSGASAYIAEPGANAAYFGNISLSNWRLSERPLLLIIIPVVSQDGTTTSFSANISVLTPSFEATRAKLIPVPSANEVTYPEWPEEINPYEVALSAVVGDGDIFTDGNMRQFVVDGLRDAANGRKVLTAPIEVRRLRERKSPEEIDILKCANELTLLALRAAREKMYIGITESEARNLVTTALTQTGLQNAGALTLFGENAALPHGSGTDRVLQNDEFVLVDCGGSLYGYQSDLTRTFALDDSKIISSRQDIWKLVHKAQSVAMLGAMNGTLTGDVDLVARTSLDTWNKFFTHRLGHGIGLEGHESPYLLGGSKDIILTGHTFSNEPGIYVENWIGIRLEDCFYINELGFPEYLTEGVGGQAKSPWIL
ncbi:peptidase M24, structural domain-containing protein [Abortiporus biennis]|nr:peptidase M24, structural domain-containing protein [Abortiporus biennis]